MSSASVAIALNHSRSTGTAKLVLIGIAEHDGDGGSWPSVATLARYANVDRRNVQRAVEKLEALNEVRRHVQMGGDHRFSDYQRPNRYDFVLTCPVDCDGSRSHRTRRLSQVDLDIEIDPAAVAPPPGGSAARALAVAPPKPSSNSTQDKTEKKRRVSNARASEKRGECGHVMVTDRYCAMGCLTKEIAS